MISRLVCGSWRNLAISNCRSKIIVKTGCSQAQTPPPFLFPAGENHKGDGDPAQRLFGSSFQRYSRRSLPCRRNRQPLKILQRAAFIPDLMEAGLIPNQSFCRFSCPCACTLRDSNPSALIRVLIQYAHCISLCSCLVYHICLDNTTSLVLRGVPMQFA